MDLDKIIAISGKPGLYRLINQTKGGFIVESLADQKKVVVGVTGNVSVLSDIAIYTYAEELPLKEVFHKMHQHLNGDVAPNHKTEKTALLTFFETVLPEYDQTRVYQSDIKKIVQWYNILLELDFFKTASDEEE